MDINRLREFLVLSEQLNYSKAANLLYITQPVLSRHIHDLEETFGGQLFIRDTHSVRLTEFGALCADQIRNVVDVYENAIIRIKNASDTSADSLTVGFLDYAVRPFLNQFAAWFSEMHPNIEVEYDSGDLESLTNAVLEDRVDLAYVTHSGADPVLMKDFECELIYEDQLLAVFHPSQLEIHTDTISLAELSEHPLITYSRTGSPYTAAFHQKLFENKDLSLNIVKEVTSLESGLFYAKAGLGALIIPQHLSRLAEDLIAVPIADEDAIIPLHLIWKENNPKESLQTFVRDFKVFYKNRR